MLTVLKKILKKFRSFGIHTKNWFFFILDSLILIGFRRCQWLPKQTIEQSKNKILIIRTDGIGDFILWLNTAKALREHFSTKNYHMTLIIENTVAALAKTLPYFDQVIGYDSKRYRSSFIYHLKWFLTIRKTKYQLAIHPVYSRHQNLFDAESLIRACIADQKIGYRGEPIKNFNKWVGAHFYTTLIKNDPKPLMELYRNAELLSHLKIAHTVTMPHWPLPIADEKPIPNPYYILFPGAQYAIKRWPATNFAKIATPIHKKYDWQGIICGNQQESALAQQIIKQSTAPLIDMTGKTDIKTLIALIKNAQLLITNDTVAVHIGAVVQTKTICMLGGGQFGRFLPYPETLSGLKPIPIYSQRSCFNCNWVCPYQRTPEEPAPCMAEITSDQVCLNL